MERITVTRMEAEVVVDTDPGEAVEEVVKEAEEDSAVEEAAAAAQVMAEEAVEAVGAARPAPEAAEAAATTGAPAVAQTTGGKKRGAVSSKQCVCYTKNTFSASVIISIVITTCSLDHKPRGQVTMNNVPYLSTSGQ